MFHGLVYYMNTLFMSFVCVSSFEHSLKFESYCWCLEVKASFLLIGSCGPVALTEHQ